MTATQAKSRVMQQTPLKLEHCFGEESILEKSTSEDSLNSPEVSFISSVPLR